MTTGDAATSRRERQPRGSGRIFLRGPVWWIAYCHRGKELRESSHSQDESVARKLLRHRLREIGADQLGAKRFVGPRQERVSVDELLDDYETEYRVSGRKALGKQRSHVHAVRAAFTGMRAVDMTTAGVRRVVAEWQGASVAPATINRRLAVLRRAFALAVEAEPPKLAGAPRLPKLEEHNARQGFFDRGELLAVLAALPDDDLRDFTEWAYWTGMRKGESAALTWATCDRETWTLRLHARDAKTGKGRVLALDGPLRAIMERRLRARRLDTPLIFHRDGAPVGDFRKAWGSACRATGLSGRLFHDLRRTGVRNLVRAGVPQSVAMAISGHRTDSVFRRYDITSETDLREAVRKVTAYVESLPTASSVTLIRSAADQAAL
jgi:integrase